MIDVRGKVHFDIVHLEGAVHLPLKKLRDDPAEFRQLAEQKKEVFVMCRKGNASKEATEFILQELGLKNVKNVVGGIEQYIKTVDNSLPLY